MRRMVSLALAAALGTVIARPAALAAPRYSTWTMSCNQVRGLIASQGAVVMYTNPASARGPETYERLVRSGNFCLPHEVDEIVGVRTRDGQCPVAHCVTRSDDDFFFRRR
jgi:hypothetical protein